MYNSDRIKKIRDCVPQKMFFDATFEKSCYASSILAEIPLCYDKVEYGNILNCSPLLTKKQEYHFFRKFNYLRYRLIKIVIGFEKTDNGPKPCKPLKMERLGDKKLKEIEEIICKMNDVRNILLKSNLRLIVKQVSRHTPRDSFERDEFISNAYLHVLKAIDCFDFTKGFKFSTYCINVIRTNLWKDMMDLTKRQQKLASNSLDIYQGREESLSERNEEYNKKIVDLIFEEIKKSVNTREKIKPEEKIYILKSFFGIGQEKPSKVMDIAKALGCARQSVESIRNRTLNSLKHLNYDPLV
jgi:RNA polymerase sigma factor (sigma-70 family)